ncbi:hypothetical protein M5C72_10215 [Companilactobacillus allii]|uniref:Uncharacterized protein n=1 Tax=Companilactobacillus allii TaxID=1847728 RepID=A0A1P8PZV8_9LACO|nr:hypothetical protein [Companilactobacillus allii]APX71135.1 hypothetical protein BTM29_00585 [Companilactobacillus allii]USQ68216.1 hypothetical protein M5C72_10215 [Companilactobacillus allii]
MNYFSIKQISYKAILVVSMILFFVCYYLDKVIDPSNTEFVFVVGYMFAIMLAAFWSIINYIDHLRINPLYKTYDSIDQFIRDLDTTSDEKMEIRTMMVDYVTDQKELGKNENTAIAEIISQFKNEELHKSNNMDVFFVHVHKYLLGLGLILIIAGLFVYLVAKILNGNVLLLVLQITLFCYAAGFFMSFVMYNILNKVLIRK